MHGFVHLICLFYIHFTRLYAASVAVEMGELKLFKYMI